MTIIKKQISLEPITSRLPSIWPSYKDGKLFFFDDESLKKRDYDLLTNYDMIPLNIALSGDSFETVDTYVLCSGDTSPYFTMSFETIRKWYHFFNEYYRLLNSGHCGVVYKNAVSYYETEINSPYDGELEYGTDRDYYVDLDAEYKRRGGKDFYDWICTYVIPTYTISKEYKDYWHTSKLFYSDVIKWISWFEEREPYESDATFSAATDIDTEHWNCKNDNISDCCDCDEYFKRGGKREHDRMVKWYGLIQYNIKNLKQIITDNLQYYIPSICCNVEIMNSLDNLGQYSILSPNYEIGVDYRTTDFGGHENTNSGTTVIDEDKNVKILNESGAGFCFSSDYMEKIYDEEAWDDYTLYYIDGNKEDFISSAYTYYAFDNDNKMYTGISETDVISAMSSGDTYELTYINSVLIGDILYPIEKSEYGVYEKTNPILGGLTFFVKREDETNTPYTLINGRKIYGTSYLTTDNGLVYYFPFFKNEDNIANDNEGCHDEPKKFDIKEYKIFNKKPNTSSNSGETTYILYNGKMYSGISESSDTVVIDGYAYPRISAYTYDKNDDILYVCSSGICDSTLEVVTTCTKEGNIISAYTQDGNVIHGTDVMLSGVTVYKTEELTGYTISRLNELEITNKLSDDVGDNINGLYNESCKEINKLTSSELTYSQPPIYSSLEPLYQVGNTSLIYRFKLTKEKESEISNNTNYFVGNIITNMKFYYKDVSGNIIEDTVVECNDNVSSSLSAITLSTTKKEKIEETGGTVISSYTTDEGYEEEIYSPIIIFDDNIYCDIKYYIGATLKLFKENESSSPKFSLSEKNYGVEYNETVQFIKTQTFYKLKMELDEKEIYPKERYYTVNLSHKYPIYTYELMQNNRNDDDVPLAEFKTLINLYNKDEFAYDGYDDMDTMNGMIVSPIYKEEYNIGMASSENVESDIYIDRGINSAFERHLKLGEVTSIESLEQYGVNFFNVMNN